MNTLVLRRRLVYVSAMVFLLIPLYFLGHPSVRTTGEQMQDSTLRPGGTLAQIRTHYSLHHSDLGELDPASESARLATLGLRGVAATILWQKAEFYKREKYFDRLAATVNQLRILQPHFIKVWEFQAHNLAWNVSVEFDDYRQRYEWVKKGINFLIDGSKYNKSRTEMPFELGWAFGNKLGMSDERIQFRQMYRDDRNFHNEVEERSRLNLTQAAGQGPDGKPDNWRGGALWYNESYRMVDSGSRPARSPLMFYCKSPQWQYKHAEAIQTDGYLGEEARTAWKLAGISWYDYGQRQIRTSFGTLIFLNELKSALQRYENETARFKEFCGDVYTDSYEEVYGQLSEAQRAALKKDYSDLSIDEMKLVESARIQLDQLSPLEIAKRLPAAKQIQGQEMANQLGVLRTRIDHIDRYRNQINYGYWEARCIAEQDDAALLARTSMYEAEKLLDLGKLQESLEKFDTAWQQWDNVFNKYPTLIVDDAADEVVVAVERYFKIQDMEVIPSDFPLKDFFEFRKLYSDDLADPAMMSLLTQWSERYPDRRFLSEMLNKTEKNSRVGVDEGTSPSEIITEADPESINAEENSGDAATTEQPTTEQPTTEQPTTEGSLESTTTVEP